MKNEEKWSDEVKTKYNPPEDLFTRSSDAIAVQLKKDSGDYGTAMRRLTFYINRAGKNLKPDRLSELNKAKDKLKDMYNIQESNLMNEILSIGFATKRYLQEQTTICPITGRPIGTGRKAGLKAQIIKQTKKKDK